MTTSLNISDSVEILSSSMLFFYVFSYHWLHIQFGDLIFRNNMAEIFRNVLIPGFDDIDLCSSLSSVATILMLPLAPYSWLGAMLPHSDTFPIYNFSFQSGDASSARFSIWEDPESPDMVLATFSGASPFHTRLCPKSHNMETQRWAFHWRHALRPRRCPPLKNKKQKVGIQTKSLA